MFFIEGQLVAKKEVFGSKYGATSGQGLQKAKTVTEAINQSVKLLIRIGKRGARNWRKRSIWHIECSGLRNPTGFEQLTRTSELLSNGSNWHRTEYLLTTPVNNVLRFDTCHRLPFAEARQR